MHASRPVKVLTLILAACAFVPVARSSSPPENEFLLHSFDYTDGTNPHGAVFIYPAGYFLGTTSQDGPTGAGTVYQLSPNGIGGWGYEVAYNFCSVPGCSDGISPQSGLIIDSAGNLYGTTSMGGDSSNLNCGHGCGVVYELTTNGGVWTETVLYAFSGGSDGATPISSLAMDSAGNIYGTTSAGGVSSIYCAQGCGVLFTLRRGSDGTWTQKVLHAFCSVSGCIDGAIPNGVAVDAAGNLYCTTAEAGRYGGGTLLQVTARAKGGWTGKLLHSFGKGSDGVSPNPGLAFDALGDVYGTTNRGGSQNSGIAFEMTLDSNHQWIEKNLHTFCSALNCTEGGVPLAGLTIDSRGRLFGSTSIGGTGQLGTLYMLEQYARDHWNDSPIYSSVSGNFDNPVTLDASGNLFTTTTIGGTFNVGSAIEVIY
ncbi:MAG TPA: choice-of-anchor tandem repeat GloVer-containing protein [Candidatus Eisenbacteria bacterium]|nr:choice-of-anchor tandem repeat GloVer-containing protein [Candidatus Eisenbacteria bacterium]